MNNLTCNMYAMRKRVQGRIENWNGVLISSNGLLLLDTTKWLIYNDAIDVQKIWLRSTYILPNENVFGVWHVLVFNTDTTHINLVTFNHFILSSN
jgi:hypothetical protein